MAARVLATLLVALAAASLPAAAQVYKWTGPDGRTHYGDRPPEDAKKQELRIGVQSFGGDGASPRAPGRVRWRRTRAH